MPSKILISIREKITEIGPRFLVTIDPSIIKTGIAVFSGGKLLNAVTVSASASSRGIGEESDKAEYDLLQRILRFIKREIGVSKEVIFILEKPMHFGNGSARGSAAASSGRIGKLYRIEGIICGMLRMEYGYLAVMEITPLEWKGNLPKEVTTRKVNETHGLELMSTGTDSDKADAIAIGDRVLSNW